jgi:uncharacterized membrane protein YhaH (DUF805 family)
MLKVLLSPFGRIRRDQFWWAWICLFITGFGSYEGRENILGLIGSFISLYLTIAIFGKRMHDFNASAWRLLVPFILTIACLAFGLWLLKFSQDSMFRPGSNLEQVNLATNASILIICFPLVIWLLETFKTGLRPGTSGDNRYGPDPREKKVLASRPARATVGSR